MATLPHNVERLADRGGFRYVAYAADGFSCRLNNRNGDWDAYATLTGAYIGRGRTLRDIGAKVATFKVRTTYAEALRDRVAGMAAWNYTTDETRNIVKRHSNQYGKRLTFADNSVAFIPAGSASVRVVTL